MFIYNYDEKTKEYLDFKEAEADPEETRLQGFFVPLVPANATLQEPPKCDENKIQVFEQEKWTIYDDFRSNFNKVNDSLDVMEIDTIGEQIGYYVVTKELGAKISENPSLYKIENGEIVEKTQEELAKEEQERIAKLFLTRADVFRALLKATGTTRAQIRALIENNETISEVQKELALIDFDEALNFYRGNPLIDIIGTALAITPKQLDLFFETNDYHYLEDINYDTTTQTDTDTVSKEDTDIKTSVQ